MRNTLKKILVGALFAFAVGASAGAAMTATAHLLTHLRWVEVAGG